ncbi:MAG: hypothetical protein R3258_03410 [Acidimicrobiia bacterium]|nr:hypothetical protein [Acidimicrobiia bacterium]
MSELLEAAATALDTPAELVRRSAAARAEATGATIDEVLAAWAGEAPAPSMTPQPPDDSDTPEAAEAEAPAAAIAVEESPVIVPVAVEAEAVPELEEEEPLEPVSMSQRLRTAVRIGAWTGAALGVIGFFMASSAWAPNAMVDPDAGPVIAVDPNGVLIASALLSVVFGAIVAGLSRSATAWANPAMELSSSKSSTPWIGGVAGLVLGLIGGGLLTGQGTEIEGSEGLVQIPVLGTLMLLVLGGALLGALTAALPQLLGTPVAVAEEEQDEVEAVRKRLGSALAIPVAGIMLLVFLVLPFAYALIQSNHLTAGGASIIAILTAGGILGFAALSGTRPQMKISFGELMVAVAGIGTVLLIIIAVLFVRSLDDHESGDDDHAAAIELLV